MRHLTAAKFVIRLFLHGANAIRSWLLNSGSMKILTIAFALASLSLAQAEEPMKADQGGRSYLERFFNPRHLKAATPPTEVPRVSNPEPWELFSVGSLPPGKALTPAAAANLKVGDYSTQTVYLIGTFISGAIHDRNVTFSYAPPGTKRGEAQPDWATAPIRIIVEYCPDVDLPMGGSKITLDQPRGFLLRAVKRSSTFQNLDTLVLFARDIVQHEGGVR
jgi:hypothetical protein